MAKSIIFLAIVVLLCCLQCCTGVPVNVRSRRQSINTINDLQTYDTGSEQENLNPVPIDGVETSNFQAASSNSDQPLTGLQDQPDHESDTDQSETGLQHDSQAEHGLHTDFDDGLPVRQISLNTDGSSPDIVDPEPDTDNPDVAAPAVHDVDIEGQGHDTDQDQGHLHATDVEHIHGRRDLDNEGVDTRNNRTDSDHFHFLLDNGEIDERTTTITSTTEEHQQFPFLLNGGLNGQVSTISSAVKVDNGQGGIDSETVQIDHGTGGSASINAGGDSAHVVNGNNGSSSENLDQSIGHTPGSDVEHSGEGISLSTSTTSGASNAHPAPNMDHEHNGDGGGGDNTVNEGGEHELDSVSTIAAIDKGRVDPIHSGGEEVDHEHGAPRHTQLSSNTFTTSDPIIEPQEATFSTSTPKLVILPTPAIPEEVESSHNELMPVSSSMILGSQGHSITVGQVHPVQGEPVPQGHERSTIEPENVDTEKNGKVGDKGDEDKLETSTGSYIVGGTISVNPSTALLSSYSSSRLSSTSVTDFKPEFSSTPYYYDYDFETQVTKSTDVSYTISPSSSSSINIAMTKSVLSSATTVDASELQDSSSSIMVTTSSTTSSSSNGESLFTSIQTAKLPFDRNTQLLSSETISSTTIGTSTKTQLYEKSLESILTSDLTTESATFHSLSSSSAIKYSTLNGKPSSSTFSTSANPDGLSTSTLSSSVTTSSSVAQTVSTATVSMTPGQTEGVTESTTSAVLLTHIPTFPGATPTPDEEHSVSLQTETPNEGHSTISTPGSSAEGHSFSPQTEPPDEGHSTSSTSGSSMDGHSVSSQSERPGEGYSTMSTNEGYSSSPQTEPPEEGHSTISTPGSSFEGHSVSPQTERPDERHTSMSTHSIEGHSISSVTETESWSTTSQSTAAETGNTTLAGSNTVTFSTLLDTTKTKAPSETGTNFTLSSTAGTTKKATSIKSTEKPPDTNISSVTPSVTPDTSSHELSTSTIAVNTITRGTSMIGSQHTVTYTQKPVTVSTSPVFIKIEIRMNWVEFCNAIIPFYTELREIINTEKQILVENEQFIIRNLPVQFCSEANPMVGINEEALNQISVEMFIVNSEGKVDISLTVDASDVIEMGFKDTSSIFKDKIVHVTLHRPLEVKAPDTVDRPVAKEKSAGVTMVIVIAAVGGCCCVVIIMLQVVIIHRRVASKKLRPFATGSPGNRASLQSMDHVALGVIPKSRPNSGFWNPGLDHMEELAEPSDKSHMVHFTTLANFCMDLSGIHQEFQKIPCDNPDITSVPLGEEDKNRFANVLPYKHTRVRLKMRTGDTSNYINANFVSGFHGDKSVYIATQSPLVNTVDDFWRMVWEQQSRAILMLNPTLPSGKPRQSTCYWPDDMLSDCMREYGDYTVTLKKREVQQDYIDCTLEILDIEKNLKREVHHFWLTCWHDNEIPEPLSVVKFVLDTRPHYEDTGAPVVVHCGPGTGRTGAVIAIDKCMRMFERNRNVDILQCIHKMRGERAGVVQTKEQYALIYQALNEYAVILSSPSVSTRSSVITLHAML